MIGIMAMAAAMVTCPARHDGAALREVAIFDGPVSDHAILAPDSTRRIKGVLVQTWPVDGVYRAGRTLNLRCDYVGGASTIVAVRKPVRTCQAAWRGREPHLACR